MRPWLPLALGACVHPGPPAPGSALGSPDGTGRFVLLHTNDMHSHFLPTPAEWLEGSPAIGGFEALDAFVRTERARGPAASVLLLDAGDLLSGTPLSELEAGGVRGGELLRFVEELGYDAVALGNHEFDPGWDAVSAFAAASPVPLLCANLEAPGGGPALPRLQAARVVEVGGVRVGIFGLITPGLQTLVSPAVWERVALRDPAESAAAQVRALDPGTDVLIALSHLGLEDDRALARAVPGIDLIVGGHSHDALTAPERVGETWIVQAGSYARSAGRLQIEVAGDAIAALQGGLVDLVPQPGWQPASEGVRARVARVEAEVDARFGQVVGEALGPLQRERHVQGALGVWVSEVLREAAGADAAFFNAGGLRADLPAGTLTHAMLYEVLPFGNRAVTFTLTGEELRGLAARAARAEAGGGGSAPQCAGLTWRWREAVEGVELLDLRVGGAPLEPARSYLVASNDYVGTHLGEILELPARPVADLGATVLELCERALARGPLQPPQVGSTRAR